MRKGWQTTAFLYLFSQSSLSAHYRPGTGLATGLENLRQPVSHPPSQSVHFREGEGNAEDGQLDMQMTKIISNYDMSVNIVKLTW